MSNVSADDVLLPTPVVPERLGVVLFDVPGEQFAGLCSNLRRLSGRPLRFCWLPTGEEEAGRVLVRVESPPELVIGRVLDMPGVRAFAEQSPGIWVQLGYRHPRIEALACPADHFQLLRFPNECETIRKSEFVGEIESLLVDGTIALVPGEPPPEIAVRLRLLPAPIHEPPRLWVLREDALAQLTSYCRNTHQQLLTRFSVAVSSSAGVPCVVLRANSVKGPPPVFVGQAVAYQPVLKLANLFLPEGTRLAPPIRRDAIQRALALSSDRVTWLNPIGEGRFQAESLHEAAFRPLEEWIEYKASEAARPLKAWAQSQRWEFEPFVERTEPKPRPKPVAESVPMRPKPRKRGLLSRTFGWLKKLQLSPPVSTRKVEPVEPNIPVQDAVKSALGQGDRLHLARPETSNSAIERVQTLEGRFLQTLPNLGADSTAENWAELAAAYDAAANHADAAICWLNALWGQGKLSPLWAWGWLRAEAKAARPEVRAIDPSPWLAAPPGPGSSRAMAAWVVWAGLQTPPPPALSQHAAALQARLESCEHWLPVRAAWLSRAAMARFESGDVLGLARTRDRIAGRLLAGGLSPEMDTPSFLRFTGEGLRERFREARRWLVDKRDLIHQWIARLPEDAQFRPYAGRGPNELQRVGFEPNVAATRAYVDLVLAWGLTRFAEHSSAESIRKQGIQGLPTDAPVHDILRDAFQYRIAQVKEGKKPHGALPKEILDRIDSLTANNRYPINMLREYSRILEPTVRVSRYGEEIASVEPDSPVKVIATMAPDRLEAEIGKRLAAEAAREGRPHLAGVMGAVLDRAFDLPEDAIEPVLEFLPPALDSTRDVPRELARLIEKGLAAAALWDRADLAHDLANRFLQLADGRAGWDMAETLTGQVFRTLRRLGLKADADRVLHQVAEHVLRGQSLARLRSVRPAEWPDALRVLLHAAAGWYYAGRDEQAHAVLDKAREELFGTEITARYRTTLAIAYAGTLAQAPARIALGRLEEMFQRLKGLYVVGTTNQYYALKPLLLVETAVRAVVSDEFALGPQVRAWLDADELAVRRRIRDELKELMVKQGL